MGEFSQKVRAGKLVGPRKRAFTSNSWKVAFARYSAPDTSDQELYSAGLYIHRKLAAIRSALVNSSAPPLSTETRIKALVAAANREFDSVQIRALSAAAKSIPEDRDVLHVRDIAQLEIETAGGVDYSPSALLVALVDALSIPLKAALSGRCTFVSDGFSDVQWEHIAREINLASCYKQAENIWEDCVWNKYSLDVGPYGIIIAVPTDLELKRGVAAAMIRRIGLSVEAMYQAVLQANYWRQHGLPPRMKQVAMVVDDDVGQRIELGDWEEDLHSQTMLFGLRRIACPPYLDAILHEPQAGLEGMTLSQLLDAWMVVSGATKRLWEQKLETRNEVLSSTSYRSIDMEKYVPCFEKDALVAAVQEASNVSPTGANALVEFLIFCGGAGQQLWSQPLISTGRSTKLYPVAGAIVASPEIRFIVELWMVQLDIDLGSRGVAFENYIRDCLRKAVTKSLKLSKICAVVPRDFTFRCEDESFGQMDVLFRVGSQVFVIEVKCIREPTESASIGTHRKSLEEGALQSKARVELINEHRVEFILAMKQFGWELPQNFVVHPLIAVSTTAHVGVACDGVPVVDRPVLERFFAGGYDDVVFNEDFAEAERIWHPFYDSVNDAEPAAANYFARPPQLEQYLKQVKWREVPIYAVSEDDWRGVLVDYG